MSTIPDPVRVIAATVGFFALWVVVYGGASALSGVVPWRIDLALPGEQHIPLVPLAAIPYLSLGALQLLAPAVLRRWERVRPLLDVLVVETLAAAAVFVLLPVRAHPWIDPAPEGVSMAFADRMNLEHNFFPSLHVTYAITSALAISRCVGPAAGALCWAWAVAIAVSTVLLRQHYLLDVAGGVLLAVSTDRILNRRQTPTRPS